MSEYRERHSVSRLIGAPPGYVGYDEGGQLTEAVRRRPYQVILFDEIEKAHPEVWNVLLQVLDDGRLTDGQGHVVDFRNTVHHHDLQHRHRAHDAWRTARLRQDGAGANDARFADDVRAALKRAFRPEFLNRIDESHRVPHAPAASTFAPSSELQFEQIRSRVPASDQHRVERRGARLAGGEGLRPAVRCAAPASPDAASHRGAAVQDASSPASSRSATRWSSSSTNRLMVWTSTTRRPSRSRSSR